MTFSRRHLLFIPFLLLLVSTKCTDEDEITISDPPDEPTAIDSVSTIFLDGQQFTTGIEGPAVDVNGNLFAVNYSE